MKGIFGRMNNEKEILQFIEDSGTIDLAYIQEQMEMKKREELLKKHKYKIWFNEKEQVWYTTLPDDTKKYGRKNIKRKDRTELEKSIIDHYTLQENIVKKEVLTVEKLFYKFLKHKTNAVGSSTIKRMKADWERFYKSEIDFIKMPIHTVTKIDVDDFFSTVITKHSIKKKAFYNMCGILKQMFEYAVDAELLEKSPYRIKVNKKKLVSDRKDGRKEVYKPNEVELLVKEMERRLRNNPSNTAPLAVLLDFELGTRKGEILAISPDDIVGDKIHIHRQVVEEFDVSDLDNIKSLGYFLVEYTKSIDGDRWLPLTQRAKEIIARVLEINKKYGYSCNGLLFGRKGTLLSPDTIDAQIKRGCEYIGIPVKTMHKIRKTYASTLLHNGVNVSIVKDMLGHADETTTLRHYIFNIVEETETDNLVLNVLEGKKKTEESKNDESEKVSENEEFVGKEKSEQSEQKIISFSDMKKAPKPLKIKGFRA
ncbi:MAG: tyrosine-type recombinase/integrase [Lachnospiraceae bacterium]|nr:tyrosine-type recombinase/integrase [Lachnospiraceae bacterium]